MKKIWISVLLAMASFVCTTSGGTLPWSTNGVNWSTNYYNPDVQIDGQYDGLPAVASPIWTVAYNTAPYALINNYLRLSATNGTRTTFSTTAGWNLSTNATVEVSMRVVTSEGSYGAANMQMGNGTIYQTLFIHADKLVFGGNTVLHDMTSWTTFRVTFEGMNNIATAAAKIYFDNNATAALTNTTWSTSTINYLRFGDQNTTSSDGITDWDYVAWTSEGAFAPGYSNVRSLSLILLSSP